MKSQVRLELKEAEQLVLCGHGDEPRVELGECVSNRNRLPQHRAVGEWVPQLAEKLRGCGTHASGLGMRGAAHTSVRRALNVTRYV